MPVFRDTFNKEVYVDELVRCAAYDIWPYIETRQRVDGINSNKTRKVAREARCSLASFFL